MRLTFAVLIALAAALPAVAAPFPDLITDLAPGLTSRVVVKAGDPLSDGSTFPIKNDLTALIPLDAHTSYLMVGHEIRWGTGELGGRFTRLTLRDGHMVAGQLWTSGLNNPCAGMLTPWNTILSCEEYPHDVYPGKNTDERRQDYLTRKVAANSHEASFGWVYEIDPFGGTPAGRAIRRMGPGRYSHESAEIVGDRELYFTEDFDPGFFYKFVMDRPKDMASGKLYAYQREKATWLPITDLINTHMAAEAAGATKFVRLEDVKRGPDGALYIAETGHFGWNDPFGRVWRVDPKTNRATVFAQGDGVHMAQPDNLIFDRQGRLLVCEDQYNENIAKYGLNEVTRFDGKGNWTHIASLAAGAEPTGPSFTPDGKTLYLSALRRDTSGVVAIEGF